MPIAVAQEVTLRQVISVEGSIYEDDLIDAVQYIVESGDPLDLDIVRALPPDQFRIMHDPAAGIGTTAHRTWLRLDVANPTDQAQERYLHLVTNFMQKIDVWQLSGDKVTTLLSQDIDAPFSARPIAHPNLLMQLTLEANSQAELLIAFRSHGTTALPIRILTEEDFVAQTWDQALRYLVFYMAVAVMTFVSLLAFVISPRRIFLTYALYSGAVVLYLLHRDGFTFQYFWPNAPLWNSFASLPLGMALPGLAALFSQSYLESRRDFPKIHITLSAVIVLSILPVPGALIFGDSAMKEFASLWTAVVALILLITGIYVLIKRGPRYIPFCMGWFGIVCASGIMVAALMGADVTRNAVLGAIRYAMVFDAAMIGLAVVITVLALRRERDESFEAKYLTLQENLILQERLTQLEDRYLDAHLRSIRNAQLAEATAHDIRQPIYALRHSLSAMRVPGARTRPIKDVEHQLLYLEGIVEEFVRESGLEAQEESRIISDEGSEVAEVFDAIHSMFDADAAAKGIDLKIVPTRACTGLELLLLLRVASNLVSNAIRHAKTTRIVVGCRWINGAPWLCVVDQGCGPSSEMLARIANDTCNESTDGLGLSIVKGIAEDCAASLKLHALPTGGSCFSFELPQAGTERQGTKISGL